MAVALCWPGLAVECPFFCVWCFFFSLGVVCCRLWFLSFLFCWGGCCLCLFSRGGLPFLLVHDLSVVSLVTLVVSSVFVFCGFGLVVSFFLLFIDVGFFGLCSSFLLIFLLRSFCLSIGRVLLWSVLVGLVVVLSVGFVLEWFWALFCFVLVRSACCAVFFVE